MNRIFTKDATGIAPNGRWYAGDINALQDAVAGLSDFTQNVQLATLAVGDSGLLIVKYGAGEARLTGSFRVDGVLRALNGLIAGTFTTTQRDAIGVGLAPYGLIILNSTTNKYEWNHGTDGARDWKQFGFDPAADMALIGAASSLDFTAQTAANFFLSAKRAGDTLARVALREDGRIEWGNGADARDTALERLAAGTLGVGGRAINATIVDTLINMPAQPMPAGTMFFATNTLGTWLSTGAAWLLIGQRRPRITAATFLAAPFSTIPYDGQEVAVVINPGASQVLWSYKYNAALPAWEFLGGAPWVEAIEAETANLPAPAGSFVDPTGSPGPSITIPLTGSYVVTQYFAVANGAGGGVVHSAVKVNAAGTNDANGAGRQIDTGLTDASFYSGDSVSRPNMPRTYNKDDVLKMQYLATNNQLATKLKHRTLSIEPVRI